jgi:hypothetical protein
MANIVENGGRWGPIEEGSGTIKEKSYHGREIVLDFDGSDTTSTLYTDTFKVPVSTDTTFVWNTEAVDCGNTADVEIFWQGTEDPSSIIEYGGVDQQGVSGTDNGWNSVTIMDLDGSSKCDALTTANLSGIAGITNMPYMRLKFVLTAATPGDVDIKCRLTGLPSAARITHSALI